MTMLKEALLLWRRLKIEKTTSLQLRLFAFLAIFILIVALASYFIMILSGVLDLGAKEGRVWAKNELEHLSDNVSSDFSRLSVAGTAFAEQLASDIDAWLQDNGMTADRLQDYPDQLEALLSEQAPTLLTMMETSKCSGTFIILDATVSPGNDAAADSRAGIYLKRTEPNAINLISSKIYYLFGPASIARENGIGLLGKWRQEFAVSDAGYYWTTLNTARENSSLPISRLYYWTDRLRLEGNSESALLLCIPLRSADGTVFGVCGLEFSGMLFKLQYSPDNSRYPGIFSTLAPVTQGVLDTDAGLIAGNSYLTNPSIGQLCVTDADRYGFYTYQSYDGAAYIGIHDAVNLYPADSPHQDTEWVMAVVIPMDNWNTQVRGDNTILYLSVLGLLALSLLLAVFISRRYISPVVAVLGSITNENHTQIQKTNIAEIDDLLEYLAERDEQHEALSSELEKTREHAKSAQETGAPNLSAYEEFVKNIDTLSTAEKAVFNLYMRGYTAKEISELLYLSINTIKTHNKRIYTKLNVTSRKELMVYVQMMTDEYEKEAQRQ